MMQMAPWQTTKAAMETTPSNRAVANSPYISWIRTEIPENAN